MGALPHQQHSLIRSYPQRAPRPEAGKVVFELMFNTIPAYRGHHGTH
jgi:hypothetical protein